MSVTRAEWDVAAYAPRRAERAERSSAPGGGSARRAAFAAVALAAAALLASDVAGSVGRALGAFALVLATWLGATARVTQGP